jgi:hypothetical protein
MPRPRSQAEGVQNIDSGLADVYSAPWKGRGVQATVEDRSDAPVYNTRAVLQRTAILTDTFSTQLLLSAPT